MLFFLVCIWCMCCYRVLLVVVMRVLVIMLLCLFRYLFVECIIRLVLSLSGCVKMVVVMVEFIVRVVFIVCVMVVVFVMLVSF